MTNILRAVGDEIRAFHMPEEPAGFLYVTQENARLSMGYPLVALTECPTIMCDICWLRNGALLIIIWAMADNTQLVQMLKDIAGDCGLPPVSVLV